MRTFVLAAASVAWVIQLSSMAWAEPRTYALPKDKSALRSGPGIETAESKCLSCHSADYVTTQPPKMGASFWQAIVAKMAKSYHAPISETEAKEIVDYLSSTY